MIACRIWSGVFLGTHYATLERHEATCHQLLGPDWMSGQRRRDATCSIEGCLVKSGQFATCPPRGSPYNASF